MVDLRRRVAIGAAWMVAMRAVVNGLGIVSTLFLARLLTPEDFGIVALAGSAYAFFSVLGQFGFDSALIHRSNPSAEHYNSAWTANILVAVAISLATGLVAKPASSFFNEPRIENVVYAFALLSLVKGFENVGVVNFRKSLNFRGDFLYFVIPKVFMVLVAVSAAYLLRNYWALVIGMVTSQVITLVYSHFSQPLRPRFSLTKFWELMEFSRWVVASSFIRYLSSNGTDVIVGRLLQPAAVGSLSIAKQIGLLPSQELLAPVNRALFPGLAEVAHDPVRIRLILGKVIGATSSISVPASTGLFVLAYPLVDVFLGSAWTEVSPLLAAFALIGLVSALRSAFHPTLLARGKPRTLTVSGAVSAVTTLGLVIAITPVVGVMGVPYAMLAGSFVSTFIVLGAVKQDIGFSPIDLTRCTWRPVLAALGMAAIVTHAKDVFASSWGLGLASVLGLCLVGVLSYVALLGSVWVAAGSPEGPEQMCLDTIRKRVFP